MSGSKTITNTYDVDGIRDRKTVGNIKHEYVTMGGKVVRETFGTTATVDYLYDNNGRPYQITVKEGTSTNTGYFVLNQQGDVIALVNSSGAALPALVGSVKLAATSAVIGASVGAGTGAVSHRISTGSWKGAGKAAFQGAVEGAADGFMWGGISAGGMQIGRVALTKGKSGISFGKSQDIQMFYHTPKTEGGTIISVKKKLVNVSKTYRFRLDLDIVNGLHFHSGVGKASAAHHVIIPWLFK